MKKIPFIAISQELVGLPYELGKMDCFSLIYKYFEIIGFELPTEYKGQTLETYPELFKTEPEKAKELMIEFMEDNFQEMQIGKAFVGDIVLLELDGYQPFLAIKAGNGQIIAASEELGVKITPQHYYKTLRAFSCRKLYR